MSMPPAPVELGRVLVDGDKCDSCIQVACARVYMYRDGDKDNLLGAPLHFCSHHWLRHADRFAALALDGKCGYINETHWRDRGAS